MTTSIKVRATGLFAVLLVAACAGSPAPLATWQPPSQEPGLVSGTWTGTVTRHFTRTTTDSSEGQETRVTETYDATVAISSVSVDIEAWTLAGQATIKATQSSDYRGHFTSTLGTCDKHYTDEDLAEGGSVVDGGLGADETSYEFHLNIPGFDGGTETSMRDETGCLGTRSTETNPWPVGPVNLSGSGDVTDPGSISGTRTTPTEGGEDTVTWSFTLSQ